MIVIMSPAPNLWQEQASHRRTPMHRVFALLISFLPLQASAQTNHHAQMDHGGDMHAEHMKQLAPALPKQPGQGAFAAIQEIVEILEADPATDWSKVDIEALRQHLIDMNNVTLAANVANEPVEGGVRFIVTGTGPIKASIQRMVVAHAATMNGTHGWTFKGTETNDGADLTVVVPAKDAGKLRGLGFLGVMTHGMHHQEHHLMIARGGHPHH
jgi:hypothetical protein